MCETASDWINTIATALEMASARLVGDYSAEACVEWWKIDGARSELIDLACESAGQGRRLSEIESLAVGTVFRPGLPL